MIAPEEAPSRSWSCYYSEAITFIGNIGSYQSLRKSRSLKKDRRNLDSAQSIPLVAPSRQSFQKVIPLEFRDPELTLCQSLRGNIHYIHRQRIWQLRKP